MEGLETLTLTPEFKKNGISSVDTKRMAGSIDETVKAFDLKTRPAVEEVFSAAYHPAATDRVPPPPGSCS